jgi:hypothetical protein
MTQARISAYERLFDRAVSVVMISLGAVVAGAVALVGI